MIFFFFQAEDGIRDLVRSRGLGDVYKRQDDNSNQKLSEQRALSLYNALIAQEIAAYQITWKGYGETQPASSNDTDTCLLYTSDAADERSSVDLGGRRIIKKKKKVEI